MPGRGMFHLLRRRLKEISLEIRERPERLAVYGFAVLGGAVTLTEAYSKFGLPALVVVALVILAVLLLVLRHRPSTSGSLPSGGSMDVPYRIQIPPDVAAVKTVIQRCQTHFAGVAIDPDEDLQYFISDPYSIVVLSDTDGRVIGFIDFYFFDAEEFGRYLNGTRTFSEILRSGLLRHPEARRAQVVYVATHVHFDFFDDNRRWRGRENGLLVWGAVQLLLRKQRFPEQGLDMYGMAWSAEGAEMLEHLLFERGGPELVVKHGPAAGKPLYVRRNTTRRGLRLAARPYEQLAKRVCELVVDGERISSVKKSSERAPAAQAEAVPVVVDSFASPP